MYGSSVRTIRLHVMRNLIIRFRLGCREKFQIAAPEDGIRFLTFLMSRSRGSARKLALKSDRLSFPLLSHLHFAFFFSGIRRPRDVDTRTSVLNRESKQQVEIRWRIVGLLTVITACIDNANVVVPLPLRFREYSVLGGFYYVSSNLGSFVWRNDVKPIDAG